MPLEIHTITHGEASSPRRQCRQLILWAMAHTPAGWAEGQTRLKALHTGLMLIHAVASCPTCSPCLADPQPLIQGASFMFPKPCPTWPWPPGAHQAGDGAGFQ